LTPIGCVLSANFGEQVHIGVGFGVARSDDWGHARAFGCGTGDKKNFPRRFIIYIYLLEFGML